MNASWIMPAISIALLGAGAALAAWALLWDRPRGRKRCPKCWYDMAGTAGLVCPECGHDARREKRLRKSRRRWGWAAAGCVVMAGAYGVYVWQDVRDGGLWGLAPTVAIILLTPLPEESDAYVSARESEKGPWGELDRRFQEGRLTPWRSRLLLNRCTRRYAAEVESMIRTRPHWPDGETIWFEIFPPRWLTIDGPSRLRITPRTAHLSGASRTVPLSTLSRHVLWDAAPFSPGRDGIPPAMLDSLELDIQKELLDWTEPDPDTGRRSATVKLGVSWRTTVSVPIRIGGGIDDVLTPVRSEEIDEALRQIGAGWITIDPRQNGAIRFIRGDIDALKSALDIDDPPTIALEVELRRDGEIVARGVTGYAGDDRRIGRHDGSMWGSRTLRQRLASVSERLFDPQVEDSRWTIRLRSNPRLALRGFESDCYWDGEIEIPVTFIRHADGTWTESVQSLPRTKEE